MCIPGVRAHMGLMGTRTHVPEYVGNADCIMSRQYEKSYFIPPSLDVEIFQSAEHDIVPCLVLLMKNENEDEESGK